MLGLPPPPASSTRLFWGGELAALDELGGMPGSRPGGSEDGVGQGVGR